MLENGVSLQVYTLVLAREKREKDSFPSPIENFDKSLRGFTCKVSSIHISTGIYNFCITNFTYFYYGFVTESAQKSLQFLLFKKEI